MITLQQVFDANYKWFFVKKHGKGSDQNSGCVYWGEGGNCRCAIGCALPSKVAKEIEEAEGGPWTIADTPALYAHFGMIDINALEALQMYHDTCLDEIFHAQYKPLLVAWAKANNLTLPPDWQ